MIVESQIIFKELNMLSNSSKNNPYYFFNYSELNFGVNNPQLSLGNKNENEINFENTKNIMDDKSEIDLNDTENDDSIYFIQKQDINNNIDIESKSTNNTINILSNENKEKENINNKKINFLTFLNKKRGKKIIYENKNIPKKYHSAEDFDNIQRKIQVHFLNFLISFANDIIINNFGIKNIYI